jgi:hypothetical protein
LLRDKSHSFTVLSSPHERKVSPSGDTVNPLTNPEWAFAFQIVVLISE